VSGVTLDGLVAEVLAEIRDELRLIREELVASSNGHAVEWFDAKAASVYLSTTPRAIVAAERRGDIVAHRSTNGRVLYARADLDAHGRGGDDG
jgi:hypothetical protein